jgi:hypothetical protein
MEWIFKDIEILEQHVALSNSFSENSVQVVITSGHSHSGYQLVHQALAMGGIQSALPQREGLTPEALSEGILRAFHTNKNVSRPLGHTDPGRVWQDQAAGLFRGNLNQENWGWADPSATWLLDFWLRFDEQTRFVLVYSSPAFTVANMLLQAATTVDSLSVAVQSWIRWNAELLRFSARHPERCLLVNTVAALGHPKALISSTNNSFNLHLAEPTGDGLTVTGNLSAFPAYLMYGLLEDFQEALALYDDLESAAHLPDGNVKVRSVAVRHAWEDHLASLSEFEQLHADLKQLSERCQRADYEIQCAESVHEKARMQAEELRGLLAGSQRDTAETYEQASQLELRNAELTKENELLFMQLRQLQDALEETASAHRELERQRLELASKPIVVTPLTVPRAKSHLAEVALDMRQEIDGKNWYWAEHDGRWAGPGTHGTVRLPAMGPGRYEINLEVVDAMDPEILAGMQVMLCGIPLALVREGKSYPAMLKGVVLIDDVGVAQDWDLSFQFPSLSSPAQHGSSDSRQLAIRLRSLRLRALLNDNERPNVTN